MDTEKAKVINDVLDAALHLRSFLASCFPDDAGNSVALNWSDARKYANILKEALSRWADVYGRPLVEPSDTAALGVLRAKIQRDLDRMGMGDGAKTYAGIVLAKIDRLAGKVKVVEIEGDGWKSVWWSAGDGLKRELGVKPGSRAYIVMEEPP